MRAIGLGLLLGTLSCSRAPAALDSLAQGVLNGEDNRLQPFQAPAEVRGPLLGASAALIYSHRLLESAPDSVSLRALPASLALGLCEDEPFANEPVAAFCSGVLIDDDLVATVGHCLGDDAQLATRRCGELRLAFGYALSAENRAVELQPERVFACRRIVAFDRDIAIVQLDRPASEPLSPRPIAALAAGVGDALVVASHGAGLPLKLELAADVTEVSPESGALTIAMDTFAGSSGGGLFNSSLELVGLVTNGDVDWEAVDGCTRAAHSSVAHEHAVAASRLTEAVCDARWPSARLCDTQTRCGDGLCNGREAPACPEDCPAARCGDMLCELSERGTCREDCARYEDVPVFWLGDPATYGSPRDDSDISSPASPGCSVSPAAVAPSAFCWLAVLCLFCAWRVNTRGVRSSSCHIRRRTDARGPAFELLVRRHGRLAVPRRTPRAGVSHQELHAGRRLGLHEDLRFETPPIPAEQRVDEDSRDRAEQLAVVS